MNDQNVNITIQSIFFCEILLSRTKKKPLVSKKIIVSLFYQGADVHVSKAKMITLHVCMLAVVFIAVGILYDLELSRH